MSDEKALPTSFPDEESSNIAQQLYEQNFQLSIHNKTLSILSKLYEITMSSLKVDEVCQRIIDTLVSELKFQSAILNTTTPDQTMFCPRAISKGESTEKALRLLGKSLAEICIPIDCENNLVAAAMRENKRQLTGNMLDILYPVTTQEVSDQIENLTGVKTIIIYPVSLAGKMIGSLVVGIAKKAEDLSRAEKETLEEVIDVIAIAIDRAQLHESVEQANDELKKLDQLKDEFLSMASHELKSPMNAVKNYLWMAIHKGKDNSDKLGGYLETAYSSTQRLIALVNDLLDVSRIESGRVKLDPTDIPIATLISDSLAIFSPQAAEKGLAIESTVSPDILIHADDQKTREILNNFISNAIKYTPNGKVTIHTQVTPDSVRINVTDSGLGIADVDQVKLFQKFSRVNTSFKELATIEGTGLGLYISKQFAEMMGGSIGVDSTPGKGSTFWVELPKAGIQTTDHSE